MRKNNMEFTGFISACRTEEIGFWGKIKRGAFLYGIQKRLPVPIPP